MSKNNALNEIFREDLSDISKELLEVGIDSLLEDEIIQNFPIVNIISSVYNLTKSISDRFFIKKMLRFLDCSRDIDSESIHSFFEKYKDEDIQERIIGIIDRIDEVEKSRIIANLFRAISLRQIDKDTFFRACLAVQNCMISELLYLESNRNESVSGMTAQILYNNALLRIYAIDGGTFGVEESELHH